MLSTCLLEMCRHEAVFKVLCLLENVGSLVTFQKLFVLLSVFVPFLSLDLVRGLELPCWNLRLPFILLVEMLLFLFLAMQLSFSTLIQNSILMS